MWVNPPTEEDNICGLIHPLWCGVALILRPGSWCGVAQLAARCLAVGQARVRFLAQHHREVYSIEHRSDLCNSHIKAEAVSVRRHGYPSVHLANHAPER